MKKFLVFVLLFLNSYLFYSQTNGSNQLRNTFQQLQVLSPSPELRNIMRFDNIEVSPYTGTPDISVPLFNFQCTKNLNFDMMLKYHPDAVKKEERAGSTGLGWSLFAGGTITRVVRGLPDEMTSGSEKPEIGLNLPGNRFHGNDLDDFINNQNTIVGSVDGLNIYDKMFEALESGSYDTQHDLYYYNFMGYSGSFYVRMNNSGGLSVVKLEENSLKISATREIFNAGDPNDPNRFKIASFTIFDESGNKYFFDTKELTWTSKGYKLSKMFSSSNVWENQNNNRGDIPNQTSKSIVTGYHLSNVTPYSFSSPILTFLYDDYFEVYKDITLIKNKLLSPDPSKTDEDYYQYIQDKINIATLNQWTRIRTQFGDKTAYYHNLTNTSTKKIKSINYDNKLFIDFTYQTGRTDSNYFINEDLVKLSNIKISSADLVRRGLLYRRENVKTLKQFDFNYLHTAYNNKKMLLKDIIEYKSTVNDELAKKYKMYYNSENSYLPNLYEDSWGYCTDVNPEYNDHATNVNFIKTFVLEKMEVPTGGCIIYNYEPHKFSYIGSQALSTNLFPISRKEEIGGGIRIKNIGFFDDKNVPQNYYIQNLNSPVPNKELNYNYNELSQPLSSGSLTFSKPVFKYERLFHLFGEFVDWYHGNGLVYLQPNNTSVFIYRITTDYNNLHSLTTKGANVGYKNVTITERNNGKKILTFTSPIDFPEENYTVTYPFIPSKNMDYKRGLLLNEKNYNSDNTLISETINTYDYTENEVNVGIIPFYRYRINCNKTVCQETSWIRAELINSNQVHCHNGAPSLNPSQYYLGIYYCTSTSELMNYKIEKRVVGWAKLSKSERIDYLPNAINNITEYSYNSINKKPSIIKNIIGSDFYSTEYEYLNAYAGGGMIGHFPNVYNRISDVKKATTKFNNEVLATENILFKDINPANSGGGIILAGSEIYVPEKYQYAKGANPLEDIQTITRIGDRGNPLEIKKADGTYTTFIWGHNTTRLIAVIENCQFSEIEGMAAYANIVFFSNQNLTSTIKASLLSNYNTLRSSLQAKSQMTALIHDIGLGVVTKIDANGKVIEYNYNNLGNLQEIRDNENNLLKQYFEFYKN